MSETKKDTLCITDAKDNNEKEKKIMTGLQFGAAIIGGAIIAIVAAELIELGAEPGHMTDLITQNKTVAGMALWGLALSRIKTFGEGNIFAVTRLYAEDFTKTGADASETEGLPATLMGIRGLKFAVTITEYPNGSKRLSFRSREGSPFGAGEMARLLGGGGHERAAGASFEGSVDEGVKMIEEMLLQKYHECLSPD